MGLLASLRAWVARYPVLIFYGLTFGLEFGLVGALIALGLGLPPLVVAVFVFLPTIVAVLLTAIEGGWPGLRALLAKFGEWRVGIRWYLFALFSTAAMALVSMSMYAVAGGSVAPAQWVTLSGLLMTAIGGPLGEEAGWRGYVLPRLQPRVGALTASLIIGVLWGAVWHLPLFLSGGYSVPFGWYVLLCVAWSVLFTWVYNHTQGSLLIAVLYHWAIDVSLMRVWPIDAAWLPALTIVTCVVALVVVGLFGPRRLARGGDDGTPLETAPRPIGS